MLDLLTPEAGALFVTRPRRNTQFRRLYSQPVERSSGLICDQHVELRLEHSRQRHPERLRRIRLWDPVTDNTLIFATNNSGLPALTICTLHKMRWQVELSFSSICAAERSSGSPRTP